MNELPPIYNVGTSVRIHGPSNLSGQVATVTGAKAFQRLDMSVIKFVYTLELANGAIVHVDGDYLTPVEEEPTA